MSSLRAAISRVAGRVLPWAVLAILLTYTYVRLFEEPYDGIGLDAGGRVVHIYVEGNADTPLRISDRLTQVGPVSWSDFEADYRLTLFKGVQPGQVVQLLIERDGTRITIPWKYPGLNPGQFANRAVSGFWLGYLFWATGLLLTAHLRPLGEARSVAIAFSYLTAIGCVVGGPAIYHPWGSALLLRIVIWFGVPVYLHFHWVWPLPLPRAPALLRWGGYGLATILSIGEYLQIVPLNLFFGGFVLSVGGSLLLLAAHAVFQPTARRRLRLLLVVLFLAMVPLFGYAVLGTRVSQAVSTSLASVGLPFIPFAYFSSLYRHKLGDLELRIDRIVSVYAFLVLQGLVMLPLITVVAFRIAGPGSVLMVGAATGIISAVVTILWYPAFRLFLERELFGISVPAANLVGVYATRITTAASIPQLATFLKDEILPSLLVRQFAFLHFDQGRTSVPLSVGLPAYEIPGDSALPSLLAEEGTYRPPAASAVAVPQPWIRLVLGLRVEEDLIGLWLFGRRDPDDYYSRTDISIIESLAGQTAVALSNLVHGQRLRELYEANVSRTEEERLRLALKLHDSILNRLAALLMKLDGPAITPAFQKGYEELSNLVRGIVTDLRPPMLSYGLKPAIEELVEDRMEEVQGHVQISADLRSEDVRYPQMVELHLYRIVQESLENALDHARAATITVAGHLDPGDAEIQVQDDGIGFDASDGSALQNLIAQKHFGLAGLMERASLIGAHVEIHSAPGKGTRVQVNWVSNDD